jgi:hypothetical protein
MGVFSVEFHNIQNRQPLSGCTKSHMGYGRWSRSSIPRMLKESTSGACHLSPVTTMLEAKHLNAPPHSPDCSLTLKGFHNWRCLLVLSLVMRVETRSRSKFVIRFKSWSCLSSISRDLVGDEEGWGFILILIGYQFWVNFELTFFACFQPHGGPHHHHRSTIAFDSGVANIAFSTSSVVLNCSSIRTFKKLETDLAIHQAPFIFAMVLATLTMPIWSKTDPLWILSSRPQI